MPDRHRTLAILGVVAALAAISYAQDAAQISPEYSNDNDPYSAADARPLSETAEVHGGVTCGPTSSSPMACGVAPVFGACPDGYDLIDYATVRADLPATCWRHEDVERDAGTGIITSGSITTGTTWTFNRLTTSTAAPAQTGTIQLARRRCGPDWAGGCYDQHAPKRPFAAVIRDPYFLWPTLVDATVTSLDAAVTAYGLGHSRCREDNSALGHDPSDAHIAAYSALTFGVATGFRFLAIKVIPRDHPSRWMWIARGFSIGTAARSAQVHIAGVRSWWAEGCL